jgi:hypothetical protein
MERNMIFTEKVFDIQTQTETIFEREATVEEIAEIEKFELETKKIIEEIKIQEAARQAVLEKLGLTADEAAALLG